jgi:hypothetical protein
MSKREDYTTPLRPSYSYDDEQRKKKPTVETPSPQYHEMAERWRLPMALMGGTHEMREAKQKWLPQEPRESLGAYYNRLNRTVLFGAYKRTVQALAGLPFRRAIILKESPPELEYLKEDCDSDDSDITEFSHTLLTDLIHYGKTHVLVDMPAVGESVSLADQQAYKIRPYFSHVSPANLISWDAERIGGRDILTRIRIKEEVVVQEGEWGFKEVDQVRVIYPDRHEIWQEEKKDKWIKVDSFPNALGEIPLITIYGNKTGFMTAEPLLEDLAWLNLRHYQKLSDLDNIEHVANVPMMFGAGFAQGELDGAEIGPHRIITAADPQSKLSYVEHSGAAIGAAQKSIQQLEERMAAMGADLIVRKSVDRQTATARMLDTSESVSLLQILVNNLERGVEEMFELAGKWIDVEAEVVCSIGTYMDAPAGPNTIDLLVQFIADNQGMTVDQAIDELQRRGVLSDTYIVNGEMPENENEIPAGNVEDIPEEGVTGEMPNKEDDKQ